MKNMFENASSLADIYGLANWDIVKVSNICRMFSGNLSISNLSVITNWNVSNVTATLNNFYRIFDKIPANLASYLQTAQGMSMIMAHIFRAYKIKSNNSVLFFNYYAR